MKDKRIAFISTWPPQTTGIAEFSYSLLANREEYDVFTFGSTNESNVRLWFEVLSRDYYAVVFAVGNSDHNIELLSFLGKYASLAGKDTRIIIQLHDPTILSVCDAVLGKGYCAKWYKAHGIIPTLMGIGRLSTEYKLTGIGALLDHCRVDGFLVHSRFAEQLVKQELGLFGVDKPIIRLFMPCFEEFRPYSEKRLYDVGVFGVLGDSKMSLETLRALQRCKEEGLIQNACLAGYNVNSFIRDHADLDFSFITCFDKPSHSDYLEIVSQCGAGIQLRRHSSGESSAVLPILMSFCIPAVVSDIGSFREYPDSLSVKIDNNGSNVTRRIQGALKSVLDTRPLNDKFREEWIRHRPSVFLDVIESKIKEVKVSKHTPLKRVSKVREAPANSPSVKHYPGLSSADLVIHCGGYKTGSSAIQYSLATSRQVLEGEGILYPLTLSDSSYQAVHHSLFSLLRQGGTSEVINSFLERLECEVFATKRSIDSIILSTEKLSRLTEIDTLTEISRHFKSISIVYYVREPLSLSISSVVQSIQGSSVVVHPCAMRAGDYACQSSSIKAFRELQRRLDSKGISCQLHIKPYIREELRNQDSVSDFFATIGRCDLINVVERAGWDQNPSICGNLLYTKLMLNLALVNNPIIDVEKRAAIHDLFWQIGGLSPRRFFGSTRLPDNIFELHRKRHIPETRCLEGLGFRFKEPLNKGMFAPMIDDSFNDEIDLIRSKLSEEIKELGIDATALLRFLDR